MSGPELKRCPFCGEAGSVGAGGPFDPVLVENRRVAIRCASCFALGPRGQDAENAVEQWNRRADLAHPAELVALIEAAKAANATDWRDVRPLRALVIINAALNYAQSARAKEGK